MVPTIYGILSDIHTLPGNARLAIAHLKDKGAQKIILNGDIGEGQPTINASRIYIETILQAAADSGLETFVQPGSHERMCAYLPVIREFSQKYSNIIDVLTKPIIEGPNHNLLFIPGSDSLNTGEFQLGNELPTGPYWLIPNAQQQTTTLIPIPLEDLTDTLLNTMHPNQTTQRYYLNINDIKSKVRDGKKTLAICHVPPKSHNPKYGVDVAYFGKNQEGAIIPGITIEQQIRDLVQKKAGREPTRQEIYHIAKQKGIILQVDNVGNELLRDLYKELEITRAVNGHIHESGHHAHTTEDILLKENEWTQDLMWNSGCLDQNQCGLFEVDEDKIRFRNIKINEETGVSYTLPPFSSKGITAESMKVPPPQTRIIKPYEGIITPSELKPEELQRLLRHQ